MARRKKYKRPKPWKVDRNRLKQAAEMMGITGPVRVRAWSQLSEKEAAKLPRHAIGVCIRRGMTHCIYLQTWGSSERASETLWHELAHAYQIEHYDREEFKAAADSIPEKELQKVKKYSTVEYMKYWESPIECHARMVANEFGPMMKLTYEVKK